MRVSVFILTTVFLSNDPLGSAFAQHSMGRMMSNVEAEKEARVAIEALIGQEDAAWNKGDAAAFSARVLPQVVFTNVAGSFSVGREPFELQHAKIFATITGAAY